MSTSDGIVMEWCRKVMVNLRSEELESLIDPLLRAFNGPEEEIKNPLFRILNCEDIILSIFKTNKCSGILKDKTALCGVILSSLLSLTRQNDWKIIISLLNIVQDSDFKQKNTLIQDVWSKQELCMMPAEVVLILLNYKPAVVEKQLYNFYCMAKKYENLWESDSFQCWVIWCSKSAELFFIVSSILNQFLIYMNANLIILKIVNKFVSNIMAECEINQRNPLSIYPLEYQSFVALLMIEPEFNPCRNAIMKRIMFIKNADSKALLLLLSHFPLWMYVLDHL